MAQKDMCNFFHQGGPIPLYAMRRIQDYQAPAIWQWPRTCAARPFIRRRAQKVRARFRRQPFDAVEIYDQQLRKTRQRERIEGLILSDAGEFTQTKRTQFKLFPFFSSRQKKISHKGLL